MMDIEGKDGLIQKISQNGTVYQQLQAMQEQMNRMLQILGANGLNMPAPQAPPEDKGGQEVAINPLGGEISSHPAPEKRRRRQRKQGTRNDYDIDTQKQKEGSNQCRWPCPFSSGKRYCLRRGIRSYVYFDAGG